MMKAKNILKAMEQIYAYCDKQRKCEECLFRFRANNREHCALDHFNSVAGRDALRDAVRRIFK